MPTRGRTALDDQAVRPDLMKRLWRALCRRFHAELHAAKLHQASLEEVAFVNALANPHPRRDEQVFELSQRCLI